MKEVYVSQSTASCRRKTCALAAVVLLSGVLATLPPFAVDADTETVSVEVRFIDRIEIARADSADIPAGSLAADATDFPPSTVVQRDWEKFVAGFRVHAQPGRILSIQLTDVNSPSAPLPGRFHCRYGNARETSCDGSGFSAISESGAHITILGELTELPEQDVSALIPDDLEVTIAYQ